MSFGSGEEFDPCSAGLCRVAGSQEFELAIAALLWSLDEKVAPESFSMCPHIGPKPTPAPKRVVHMYHATNCAKMGNFATLTDAADVLQANDVLQKIDISSPQLPGGAGSATELRAAVLVTLATNYWLVLPPTMTSV